MNPTQLQKETDFNKALSSLTPTERATYNAAGNAQTFQQAYPQGFPANPSPINVTTLTTSPSAQPFPQQTYSPTTTNLGQAVNSSYACISTDASYTPPVNQAKQEAQSGLRNILSKITGQTGEVEQIRNDADLIEKKGRAQTISNEIDQ